MSIKSATRSPGRPRIHENPAWFGMKISQDDQKKIRALSKSEGVPASRIIMRLVDAEISKREPAKSLTAGEIRKLPEEERARILRQAAKLAVNDYLPGGDLYVDGNEDIVEY